MDAWARGRSRERPRWRTLEEVMAREKARAKERIKANTRDGMAKEKEKEKEGKEKDILAERTVEESANFHSVVIAVAGITRRRIAIGSRRMRMVMVILVTAWPNGSIISTTIARQSLKEKRGPGEPRSRCIAIRRRTRRPRLGSWSGSGNGDQVM